MSQLAQQQVMLPGQQQGLARLVQGTGGQKQLLFIGAGDNMGKHVEGQQIVRQVMVRQPAPAVIQSRAGAVVTQQAVMSVSTPGICRACSASSAHHTADTA